MMSLDSITLYLVATMVAALLGAMMVFFGRQENSPALKWWGTAYLLGAASVALWTAAGDRLGPHLYLALNAVGFVACGMVWNAARVFHGRKPNWPGLLVGALAWAAAVTLLDPAASMLRMIVGAGIVSVYAALTASELWVERRKSLQRRWPAFVVPVMHGCVLMLPIVLMRPEPLSFIARTASTALSRTSVVLAHVSGSSRDAEKTIFDACVRTFWITLKRAGFTS